MLNRRVLLILAAVFFVVDCLLVGIKLTQQPTKTIKPIHKQKPHYKYSIYLTSDDGPQRDSIALNQLVLDYEFPLTIFAIGKLYNNSSEIQEIYNYYKDNPYIYIGNHSYSHANGHYIRFYKNPQNVVKDFQKNEELLGISSKIARLPGRNVWVLNGVVEGERDAKASAKLLAKELKYNTFGWDYELRYTRNGTVKGDAISHYKRIKELLKTQKTFSKNQIVILMHDQMFKNQKSQEVLGELVLLLQNDDECKLKLIKDYKIPYKKIKVDELFYAKAKK